MDDINFLYKKELQSLYKELREFINNHPELSEEAILENPHTTRLIQAFSILHANVNLTLEESFIKFVSNLFDVFYPHYNVPIPSHAIICIEPDKKLSETIHLSKGTQLEMSTNETNFSYQLCYDTSLIPAKITSAFCNLIEEEISNAKSVLNINVLLNEDVSLGKLSLNKIRFFIKGENKICYSVYKTIFRDLTKLTIDCENSNIALEINKSKLIKVGFGDKENTIPSNNTSFTGYRLLTEFFAFPEKFLFFDIELSGLNLESFTSNVRFKFHLNNTELINLVSEDNFSLNAVPIINIYSLESEPIEIDIEKYEYPIIMDKQDPDFTEVYSIKNVKFNIGEEEIEGFPIFNYKVRNKDDFWYHINRKKIFQGNSYIRSKACITVGNNKKTLSSKTGKFFYIKAECFNGNMPYKSYIENVATFNFIDNTIPVSSIKCIVKPTLSHVLCTNKEHKWTMLAHLSLHYINLMDNRNALDIFKEILMMYSIKDNRLNKLIIDNMLDARIVDKVLRIQTEKYNQFCKGTFIEVIFNASCISEEILYLFLNVMDYFLAMYCSVNSFIQLNGEFDNATLLYKGSPRNGNKCFI